MSNHLTIALLLDDIGGVFAFIPPVGFGVDERTLDGEVLLVLLWLRALIGLVAFLIALEAYHGCSLLKLVHRILTVILRRLDNTLALQSCQVLHEPFYFLLELTIFLDKEIIT